ncbi:hypothetical protein LMG28138_04194 [Pararobbsia alpina]|uniref:Uncharacterized protein n=1 Tax=Pararobbsia alpina TaxID=621374 RepID=A0A6S7BRM0_9BURK|nr:hypothetical protein LMG28138_04194 [Pararobbsia alpina]
MSIDWRREPPSDLHLPRALLLLLLLLRSALLRLLLGQVMPDYAAPYRSNHGVVPRIVSRNTADDGAFHTACGGGCANTSETKDAGYY